MKKTKMTIVTTLSLILTMVMLITVVPLISAQDEKMPSAAFCGVNPKVAEVDVPILVTCWTSPVHPTPVGDPQHFKTGYMVTFTKPDSTTVTFDPLAGQGGTTFEDSTAFAKYTPTQIGTWTATMHWPGDDLYQASTSAAFTFEVVAEGEAGSVVTVTELGLPEEYWERPVPGDLRIGNYELSNWLSPAFDAGNSRWNPYTLAPNSAHILWNIIQWPAGIIGGEYGSLSGADAYSVGSTSEGWPILMGYAYVGPFRGQTGIKMVDMDTGEVVWNKQFEGNVRFAVQPSADLPHYRGINAVIYEVFNGEKVVVYNSWTAEELINPMFAGGTVIDDRVGISNYHGGYFYYTGQGHLLKWQPNVPGNDLDDYSTFTTFDEQNKTVYRVPRPAGLQAPSYYWEDVGIASGARAAYNLTTGEPLWGPKNTYVIDGVTYSRTASYFRTNAVGYGLFFFHSMLDTRLYAVDIYTGEIAWRSEPKDMPYGAFMAYQMAVGEGVAISESYDGHVYAYNVADGSTKWAFASGDSGVETPYSTYPFWHSPAIADGKVFASTSEHSAQNPHYRGNRMYAINVTDGTELWSIGGNWGGKSIADSKLLVTSESTGDLYCFARGPTATSVSIKNDVIAAGSMVLITGSVTDQSPGTKQNELALRFPNGVPAVSEDSMSDYMEYLYLKRPQPMTTGVPVTLSYIDPNGNYYDIDTITTDTEGFRLEWTPPDNEGVYNIIVSFDGTTSYWPSHTSTSILVGPAPEPIPTPTQAPAPQTDTYIAGSTIAIIAAIAVVALLLLRKK